MAESQRLCFAEKVRGSPETVLNSASVVLTYSFLSKLAMFVFSHSSVNPQGLYEQTPAPWQECWPSDECFKQVLNESNRADYLFEDEVSTKR